MAMNNPDLFDDEATDDSMSSAHSAEVYVVEKILRRRFNATENTFEYELKWKNYPESENTWEPESSLKCDFLLKQFNERRQRKKERKMARQKRRGQVFTEDDEKFVVSDNESLSQSSWTSASGDEGIKKEVKSRKSIQSSTSASRRRQKSTTSNKRRTSHVKKEENSPVPETPKPKPKSQSRKKKLGEILSYDDLLPPPVTEEDEFVNSSPSTSASVPPRKIKKEAILETPIKRKKKKPQLNGRLVKKEQLPDLNTASQGEAAEKDTKKMSEKSLSRVIRSESRSTSPDPEFRNTQAEVPPTQTAQSSKFEEEEEESDTNFQLDMNSIPYKIIEEGEENGFHRGWEVERILALISDNALGANDKNSEKYAIVKFKGFKYSHRIHLIEVKARAPEQLSTFLREKMSLQLQARSHKRSDWHQNSE